MARRSWKWKSPRFNGKTKSTTANLPSLESGGKPCGNNTPSVSCRSSVDPERPEVDMRYWLLPAAALCLLLAPIERSQAQDDPKPILEKAIKAAGGEEKLANLKNLRVKAKGTLEIMGA